MKRQPSLSISKKKQGKKETKRREKKKLINSNRPSFKCFIWAHIPQFHVYWAINFEAIVNQPRRRMESNWLMSDFSSWSTQKKWSDNMKPIVDDWRASAPFKEHQPNDKFCINSFRSTLNDRCLRIIAVDQCVGSILCNASRNNHLISKELLTHAFGHVFLQFARRWYGSLV